MNLVSYLPSSGSYTIYYPETYILNESEEGIVTITSPESASNLTISSYTANENVTDEVLKKFITQTLIEYEPISDFRSLETTYDLLIERSFIKNKIKWIWWGLSKQNQIIIISSNSEISLSDDDYNLFRFMIDHLEINL